MPFMIWVSESIWMISVPAIRRFRISSASRSTCWKVDKSFVRDMSEDNNDRALVKAIVNMASSLGLAVVAEGSRH